MSADENAPDETSSGRSRADVGLVHWLHPLSLSSVGCHFIQFIKLKLQKKILWNIFFVHMKDFAGAKHSFLFPLKFSIQTHGHRML